MLSCDGHIDTSDVSVALYPPGVKTINIGYMLYTEWAYNIYTIVLIEIRQCTVHLSLHISKQLIILINVAVYMLSFDDLLIFEDQMVRYYT